MKNNVLLVANWKSDVGYAWWLMENFWVEINKLCEENGSRCHLIYPAINVVPATIQKTGIHVQELHYGRLPVRSLFRVLAFIRRHDIKLVYLTDRPFLSWKYALFRVFGVRRIVVHDHTPGERSVPRGLKKTTKLLVNKLPWVTADAYIAVSDFVRERHIHSACVPGRKSHLVNNGIIPVAPDPCLSDYCHKQFGIPAGAVVVFTSGRAHPYKQIDFVIRCAARLIHESRHEVYFLYCGDGPHLSQLKALARSLGVEDRFIFAGQRSDVRQILQSCHIGMHASKGEGLSLSILEYMSAGLGTLVPDDRSVCASIVDGHNGLWYRAGDVTSACQALSKLIGDKPLRDRLGANARTTIYEHYNLANTNARFRSVIGSVLGSDAAVKELEKRAPSPRRG